MPERHLISPNIHVILVHFPLGIFVLGVFLETFSFLWRRSTARLAARWMILFGALLSIPAALSGIDALKDVAERSRQELSDTQWGLLQKHLCLTSIGAGIAAIASVIGLGLSDHLRKRLYIPLLIALMAAAGLMTFGSHFGGEGIFLEGVAVRLKGKPAAGLAYYAPPRSSHVLTAGLAIAVGLGALGASFRVLSAARQRDEEAVAERELAALQPAASTVPRRVPDDLTVARTLNSGAQLLPPRVPAARFWLLSTLLAIITFGLGTWYMLRENDFFESHRATPSQVGNELWTTAWATSKDPNQGTWHNRRLAHIALGAALVVLPLLLAAAVRVATRQRWLVAILCVLLIFIVASEIWIGVLLLHDSTEGPLLKFNPPAPTTPA